MIYLSKREMSKEEIAAMTEDELRERSIRYLRAVARRRAFLQELAEARKAR